MSPRMAARKHAQIKKCGREAAAIQTDDFLEIILLRLVRAAKVEEHKHFDCPGADAADGDETLDKFVIGEVLGLFERGNDAVDGFLREVFHGEDFCAG